MKKTIVTMTLIAALAVFMTASTATAQKVRAVRPTPTPDAKLKADLLQIGNNLLKVYGTTDFSWVYQQKIVQNPTDLTNGNMVVIPLAQATVYTMKYELEGHNPASVEKALPLYETAIDLYPYWGRNWISAPVANFLALGLYRLRAEDGISILQQARIETDWQKVREILRAEADAALGCINVPGTGCESLPLGPLDSSTTGDTKAEEDAWESSVLAAAAVFYPEHPNAPLWEAKAREVAYDAITRPSDPAYPGGVKTTTVTEDFSLDNHGFMPNEMYTSATIELLQQGALPYMMTGREVLPEFSHNVAGLYAKYLSNVTYNGNWPVWALPCDEGDPTDMPLAMGDGNDYHWTALKAQSGYVFRSNIVTTQATVADGDQLWAAIQAHKVAWRYFANIFLWHWPTPTSR